MRKIRTFEDYKIAKEWLEKPNFLWNGTKDMRKPEWWQFWKKDKFNEFVKNEKNDLKKAIKLWEKKNWK